LQYIVQYIVSRVMLADTYTPQHPMTVVQRGYSSIVSKNSHTINNQISAVSSLSAFLSIRVHIIMLSSLHHSRRPTVLPDTRKICQLYFGKNPVAGTESNRWKCSCGKVRKQDIKVGFTNLMSHIRQKHPNYLEVFHVAQQEDVHSETSSLTTIAASPAGQQPSFSVVSGQTTLDYMFDTRSTNVFKWLEWIIMDEHELGFCEKDLTRGNANLEPISVKTLKKYLFKLVNAVEKRVSANAMAHATSYALVFDGWSEASKHFIGMYIVYPAKDVDADPVLHLLAFAPLHDETNFTAENHANFIKATLNWYSLSVDRLFCLIGDNCSTNKATANRLGVPLLGCRSHRFNLSVEQYLRTFLAAESELVGKLMSKLATLKQSGRLRLMTALCPVKRNVTRWTGVPDMFERFERLLPNLNILVDGTNDELMDFVPSPAQKRNIRERKQALADFKSVTIALQRRDMTIKESDVLFQSIIDAYKDFNFEGYLGAHSDIIHDKPLESAVLKIQSGKENTLTELEKGAVEQLLLPSLQVQDDAGGTGGNGAAGADAQLSFAERALKRQRVQETAEGSKYVNTRFLLPTSCVVERLFSQAKRVFSPHRRRLNVKTLEALLFLNQNRMLWNLALVAAVVNGASEEEEEESEEDLDEDGGVDDW
jgi:hAT family C-terminal dimerisation region